MERCSPPPVTSRASRRLSDPASRGNSSQQPVTFGPRQHCSLPAPYPTLIILLTGPLTSSGCPWLCETISAVATEGYHVPPQSHGRQLGMSRRWVRARDGEGTGWDDSPGKVARGQRRKEEAPAPQRLERELHPSPRWTARSGCRQARGWIR